MKLICGVVAFAVAAFPLVSQELRFTSGVSEQEVFQRNPEGVADITFGGVASGRKINGKMVVARLTKGGAVVPGFEWEPIGKIQRTRWDGEFRNVPTGGPYRVEIRLGENAPVSAVDGILVGDLWVLAGQSNMEGVGNLIDVQQPSPLVHSFDMADNWVVAEEPLHTLVNAVDRVHWPLNRQNQPERITGDLLAKYMAERKKGAGLGLPFAVDMVQRTGIPIGLLPCAHGGTSMSQWSPALKDRDGDSLYGSMIRRVKAVDGRVKGILWYQGESDANPTAAPVFEKLFIDFVTSVRADLNQPNLPFYYVQIGRHISNENVAQWNIVQDAQRRAEPEIPNSGMVAAVDLTLDDGIHISTPDLKRLGHRLANLACHDLYSKDGDCGDLKRGPRPVAAEYNPAGFVKVVFTDVNGRLDSQGRISGFSIHNADGTLAPAIYKATVDPAEASVVLLYISRKLPPKATLWYGYGKDPYCNLVDAADMAAPVFGPLPIQVH